MNEIREWHCHLQCLIEFDGRDQLRNERNSEPFEVYQTLKVYMQTVKSK